MPITISGMVGKGVRFFTGVVQSVEEDKLAQFPGEMVAGRVLDAGDKNRSRRRTTYFYPSN